MQINTNAYLLAQHTNTQSPYVCLETEDGDSNAHNCTTFVSQLLKMDTNSPTISNSGNSFDIQAFMHVQYDCKYLSPGYDPGNVGHGKKKKHGSQKTVQKEKS